MKATCLKSALMLCHQHLQLFHLPCMPITASLRRSQKYCPTVVRPAGLLSMRTLVCKLLGVVCSMAGGLVAGKDLVHTGRHTCRSNACSIHPAHHSQLHILHAYFLTDS